MTQLTGGPADAAAAATPWKVGGTDAIATDGSNFIGPLNAAPIIFKNKTTASDPLAERMRVAVSGKVGVGMVNPLARLEVTGGQTIAFQSTSLSASTSAAAVSGVCSAGYGVQGSGGVIGAYGKGGSYGGYFTGTSMGSYNDCSSGPGVYGSSDSSDGVHGYSSSSNGVYGYSGSGTAIYADGDGLGVDAHGVTTGVAGTGGTYGAHGFASYAGVLGTSPYIGAYGQASGTSSNGGYGVYGQNTVSTGGYGIFGDNMNSNGYAVFSYGNCGVQGTLTKNAGSFKIDHPLDPEDKWLYHSFVESPDMMNVYNGNVTTDAKGLATITMPDWFETLNRDFRYQLTALGQFAQAIIKQKIEKGSFVIATDKPNVEVSWQVTGIRQDDYAREHPIVVEVDKTPEERGTRSFVPQGSNAKQMDLRPAAVRAAAKPAAPRRRTAPAPLPLAVATAD